VVDENLDEGKRRRVGSSFKGRRGVVRGLLHGVRRRWAVTSRRVGSNTHDATFENDCRSKMMTLHVLLTCRATSSFSITHHWQCRVMLARRAVFGCVVGGRFPVGWWIVPAGRVRRRSFLNPLRITRSPSSSQVFHRLLFTLHHQPNPTTNNQQWPPSRPSLPRLPPRRPPRPPPVLPRPLLR